MVTVYHNLDTNFISANPVDPSRLIKVAEVDTNNLEEAFRLTNHADRTWYDNLEVKVIKKSRSTSVGDVMEITGERFIVDTTGFKAVKNNN